METSSTNLTFQESLLKIVKGYKTKTKPHTILGFILTLVTLVVFI
ncbi:hypothetical protein [Alteribacillus sp. HJP-4]